MSTNTNDLTVELAHRRVIERKLLTAIEDDDCVAILASREDLSLLIRGLERINVNPKATALCAALVRLRMEAFPI